jgi:multiple sugar transport system permease protein
MTLRRWKAGKFFLHLVLITGSLVMLSPIVWMAVSTFKTEAEMSVFPPRLFPETFTLDTLRGAWTNFNLGRYFFNSLYIALIVTPVSVFTSAWVGFVLAKYQFPGKNVMFYIIIATLMIPVPMLLIPRFQVVLWFDLLNTHAAVILPALFTPFGIFLMRQFMFAVPTDLLNAARVDGASETRIFLQIVLPLVRPALGALAILEFLASWDSLLWPLVVLTKDALFTLPIGLAAFTSPYERNFAFQNAGAFIATIPVIIVFLLFQKQIVEGIAMTGTKG